jgi:hypothetical protein
MTLYERIKSGFTTAAVEALDDLITLRYERDQAVQLVHNRKKYVSYDKLRVDLEKVVALARAKPLLSVEQIKKELESERIVWYQVCLSCVDQLELLPKLRKLHGCELKKEKQYTCDIKTWDDDNEL